MSRIKRKRKTSHLLAHQVDMGVPQSFGRIVFLNTVGLDYLFIYVDSSSLFAGRTLSTAKHLRHTVWSLKILEAFPSLTVRRSVGLFVEIMLSELVRWVPSKDPIHII